MKKIMVILCVITALLLSGCNGGQAHSIPGYSTQYSVPNIVDLAEGRIDYTYSYVVDNNTGVVYIQVSGFRRVGITVALNADGTPITVNQIKGEDN